MVISIYDKNKVLSNELLKVSFCYYLFFYGGNSTFINSSDKTQFLFHSPTDAAPQFL